MTLTKKNKLIAICLFILSCKKEVADLPNNVLTTNYIVTIDFVWNNTNFPTDCPSNAHFSRLIGWTHQSNTDFFKEGTLASEGIRKMAELGTTTPLDNEINAKISTGEGLKLIIGDNLSSGVGQIKINVEVDKDHPSVTLATMLAPSPDWYLAVVNVNLFESGAFVASKMVEGIVYDAGTDNGITFTSTNSNTYPRQAISYLVSPPLGNNTSFSPSISKVTFTKL